MRFESARCSSARSRSAPPVVLLPVTLGHFFAISFHETPGGPAGVPHDV